MKKLTTRESGNMGRRWAGMGWWGGVGGKGRKLLEQQQPQKKKEIAGPYC